MEQAAEHVVEIAANVDDATGEVIGATVQALLNEGALDVWTTPIQMKKNRPGVMVSLLCAEGDRERLAERLIVLTGSFGVRYRPWDRVVLRRKSEIIKTPFGAVRVKVGELKGRVVVTKPEFEDVLKAAKANDVSPREVIEAVTTLTSDL